jgi:hypothetical protein
LESDGALANRTERPSKAWRRVLFAFSALLFSALLLGVWVSALAAPVKDSTPNKPERDPSAPSASIYDFAITKSQIPLTFTIGSNNIYYLSVTGVITTTAIIPKVEDVLPDGMTVAGTIDAPDWNCTTSTSTRVSCFYTGDLPIVQPPDLRTYVSLSPITFKVDVSPEISPTVVQNTAAFIDIDDAD